MKLIHTLGVVALLILVSCDTTSQPAPVDHGPPAAGQPPAALEQGLPPLPDLGTHAVSYIEPVAKPGIDTVLHFGNVFYGASTVELMPPDGQLAFVVYALPINGFSYGEVGFNVTFDDAEKCWFGIADYRRGSWDLTRAYSGITGVAPPYSTAHAPDGTAYFAVIAYNATMVKVNQVAVDPNIPTWQHHVIDDRDSLGKYGDIALIDGHLYVAYVATDVDEVRLARAKAAIPADVANWDRTIINNGLDTNRLGLHQVNGLPALSLNEG